MDAEPLVTIALPVFNGASTIGSVSESVLAQDYENLEFLISDNASTDETEELCREIASRDARVRYHRQPNNIGLIANFEWTKHHCNGALLRWIGDNDTIRQSCVSRCVGLFSDDPGIVLVTTQLEYLSADGQVTTARFDGGTVRSDDVITRLDGVLGILAESHLLIDPLYGMVRVETARRIRHDQMLRGDEVYAVKLALTGPWAHIPEVLGTRLWTDPPATRIAEMLDVPQWQVRVRALIATRRMLGAIDEARLGAEDARGAKRAITRFYVRRHVTRLENRARTLRTRVAASR